MIIEYIALQRSLLFVEEREMDKKGHQTTSSTCYPMTLGAKKMCFQVATLFLLLLFFMGSRQKNVVTVWDAPAGSGEVAGQEVIVSARERREAMPSVSAQQAHWSDSGWEVGLTWMLKGWADVNDERF